MVRLCKSDLIEHPHETDGVAFADALLMLAPHLRSTRIAADVFEVVGPEPDPDDFW